MTGILETYGGAVQIIGAGALDLDGGDLADLERPMRADVDGAVDLRRVAARAADGAAVLDLVDDHRLAPSHFLLEFLRADRLLRLHEAAVALGFHFVRHR